MQAPKSISNSGSFSSWHMERTAENKYSDSDSSARPAPGSRSKFLVTDGRPAGTHFRDNAWHDGGAGKRGARAHELEKFEGTSAEKQSSNDAPFMKGDRARTKDGTLRSVRGDQLIGNNPTLKARAPELIKQFGADMPVAQLREVFGGRSVNQIASMTQSQRAVMLGSNSGQQQLAAIMGMLG